MARKPTLTEIVGEAARDVVPKEGFKGFTKAAYIVSKYGILAPYVLPTVIRQGKEDAYMEQVPLNSEIAGSIAGVGISIAALFLEARFIYFREPYLLAIPVVTNILSYGYEKVKKAKKRLEERYEEEERDRRLRGVAEEPRDYHAPNNQDNRTRRIDNIIDGDR
jgi:hypothetical protein